MFVKLEVTVDHVLKQVIDNEVESETGIFGWIDTHARLEGGVVLRAAVLIRLNRAYRPP